MINIVLVEPEIPQNTGNIVRTSAATGSVLHLVRPLGFDTSDKMLKRAGLDYWKDCDIRYWDSFSQLCQSFPDGEFYFFTTKGKRCYTQPEYGDNVFLVFGRESRGLPESLLHENYANALRIPMLSDTRSLNLSNSVAIAVYEVLRQKNFDGMNRAGRLREYDD